MMNPELYSALEPLPGRHVPAGELSLFVTERGAGRTIVFIHGLGWSHGLWRRQIVRYSNRYKVIAGDSRGHGQSDIPARAYKIEDMARDWLAALDAMDIAEFCLVGFSQGGRIAQAMATIAPERIRALVVMGSGCRDNPAGRELMEKRLVAARESTYAGAVAAAASIFSPAFIAREAAYIEHFITQRAAMDFGPIEAATRALFGFDATEGIARLECPALVAVGAEDRLCAQPAALEVAKTLRNAQFAVVPDAGHMLTLEQPAAIDGLLDAFLAAHYPPLD